MGALLSKVSEYEAWARMPWRVWKSPLEQSFVLPTFVLCEWSYRALALGTLVHARRTGALPLWFSAVVGGGANDCLFMALPFVDNYWQAQASVMLTPRLPLYIFEVYAVVMYASTTAAQRLKLPYAQEAALTGLLAHLFYRVYDINGPRFLWWTWHDSDPCIKIRDANSPVGSSVWVLTYCAIHAALHRWVSDGEAASLSSAAELLAEMNLRVAQAGMRKLNERIIGVLYRFDGALLRAPQLAKILFCGAVSTPLLIAAMGVAQICSLDTIGVPGPRTYRFVVAAYLAVLGKHAVFPGVAAPPIAGAASAASFVVEDAALFKGVASFFAIHVAISLLGDPKRHISTGVHQVCSNSGKQSKDIMRRLRTEYMRSTGPCEHSKNDYAVPPPSLDGAKDPAGRRIVTPKPDAGETSTDSEWYTVVGTDSKDKPKERSTLMLFATIGIISYGKALGAL